MSEAGVKFPLSEPQRRHFEVILASLENALLEVEQLARADSPDARRLTQLEDDLPDGFLDRSQEAVERLRRQLRQLADQMQLEAQHHSKGRTIGAILTAQVTQIQDSYARMLRGYGHVDPDLAPRLDPELASMEEELAELRAILRDRAPRREKRGTETAP